MGNSTSRVVGCFVPVGNGKDGVNLEFLEPLDEGLGHSFCYVRPMIADSPAITPSNSERYTVDSSTFESETHSSSFRHEIVEELTGLRRPNKNIAETTFKTISGASVSANASTARTPTVFLTGDALEPAASFESTASFTAIPLQPVPRGSGPLNGFMSGPLERGFASGPLERGSGFMSGPLDRGAFMSGPLDSINRNIFSAPLGYGRKMGISRIMRSMSRPMRSVFSQTFSKRSYGPSWLQRFFLQSKEDKFRVEAQRNWGEDGPSEPKYSNSRNLQWAHGKAGEDRVHVVLSEEQGWLFVGIYDGFSGPDAPDFLMGNFYKAIDKELEGLLWDYDNKPQSNPSISGPMDSDKVEKEHENLKECDEGVVSVKMCEDEIRREPNADTILDNEPANVCKIIGEKENVIDLHQLQFASEIRRDQGMNLIEDDASKTPVVNLAKACRKSRRLYELLEMELVENKEAKQSQLASTESTKREGTCCTEMPENLRENEGVFGEDSKYTEDKNTASFSALGRRQMIRRSLIGSKFRQMYRRRKSLRKKFFPWSYDWHREQQVDERVISPSTVIRRCKPGPVDHEAVLRAIMRAFDSTEGAYMEMVEGSLDRNPELALMGSCVLVMLMKDQDVYVMNLGDSRVILAQDRLSDRYVSSYVEDDARHQNRSSSYVEDDARHQNRSRETLVRVELDRISEESPMHNPNTRVCNINKNKEISLCSLKIRALQLSTDHSTSIEEEVLRIKEEHPDDSQAVLNDRVKGQLKVTRAFGAGFLKKPKFNEALLEMFRIDYIGNSPYLSSIPSVLHHRLCSNDRFVVLSSDGLYQYFSNEEVISHVAWFIENVPEGDPAQYLIAELLFRAAKENGMDFHELLDIPHGDRRMYHDDVSVMVISLEGRIWRSSG